VPIAGNPGGLADAVVVSLITELTRDGRIFCYLSYDRRSTA
jgi:hypothetical protein